MLRCRSSHQNIKYIPKTRSPRMKTTTPSMSSRRQTRSTFWEWFINVWYVADSERHATAANIKTEKATESPTPDDLLARYW